MCERCDALEAELEQAEDALDQVAAFCDAACRKAEKEALGRQSGVPRGEWAFWRGVDRIAREVLGRC